MYPPVLVQKPNTRNHDNVNILAEDTIYQRKKHLEVPSTFRGNSSTILSNDSLKLSKLEMKSYGKGYRLAA